MSLQALIEKAAQPLMLRGLGPREAKQLATAVLIAGLREAARWREETWQEGTLPDWEDLQTLADGLEAETTDEAR